jgi:hypothetical protein
MTPSRYRYSQLRDPTRYIRLVTILPRGREKRLRLTQEQYPLDEIHDQYEAISYTWGDTTHARHVLVNGKTHAIRNNIWQCLKHLREHSLSLGTFRLWIDSICIDQESTDEKAQQVAMMGQIFAGASRVLVWLGATSLQTYLIDRSTGRLPISLATVQLETDWEEFLGHSDTDGLAWHLENQMMSIVYNAFWERLWIIQELALAQDVCVIYGDRYLTSERLRKIYRTVRANSKPGYRWWLAKQRDPTVISTGTHILDHHPMLEIRGSFERRSLAQLIDSYHLHYCTDPLDYVYGFFGLLNDDLPLGVNYSLTGEEIIAPLLRHMQRTCEPDNDMGMAPVFSAASALVASLKVTSKSYGQFVQGLPLLDENSPHREKYLIGVKPFEACGSSIISDQSPHIPEDEAVAQHQISGRLYKTIHQPVVQSAHHIKLLDGRFKSFIRSPGSNQGFRSSTLDETGPSNEQGAVIICWLGIMLPLILRRVHDAADTRGANDDIPELAYFQWPDMTSSSSDSEYIWLEFEVPVVLRDAINRELHRTGANWNTLMLGPEDRSPGFMLEFSVLEFIMLCELMAPAPPTFLF